MIAPELNVVCFTADMGGPQPEPHDQARLARLDRIEHGRYTIEPLLTVRRKLGLVALTVATTIGVFGVAAHASNEQPEPSHRPAVSCHYVEQDPTTELTPANAYMSQVIAAEQSPALQLSCTTSTVR